MKPKFNEDTLSEQPAIEQVMYLDHSLKEHTLLQAIARTNRIYPRKNFGLVVDYVGVGRDRLKEYSIQIGSFD